MSHTVLNNLKNLENFKYDEIINTFVATKEYSKIDIQELLDITYVLENNFIPYKICSGFNIRILKKRR